MGSFSGLPVAPRFSLNHDFDYARLAGEVSKTRHTASFDPRPSAACGPKEPARQVLGKGQAEELPTFLDRVLEQVLVIQHLGLVGEVDPVVRPHV